MRIKSGLVAISLLFSLFLTNITTVYASTFTDVPYTHDHSTAISYLQSNSIIKGYDDGTFRPDNLINRVEFLKIVLEGTRIPLDNYENPGFSDLDELAWYMPYIKKAKSEGWIEGYPDGTFRPDDPINKAEALKILGEVQNWDRLDFAEVPEAPFEDTYRFSWYSPYVHYAKENGLLFEETTYLYPDKNISRAYMAEIVYRSIIGDIIIQKAGKTTEQLINEVASFDTPNNFKEYNQYFFENIKLSSNIPNTFYKNELYIIEGEIVDETNYDSIFAFITNQNEGETEYEHMLGTVENNKFKIPLIFRNSGKFQFGIIPGRQGESKIFDIYVVDGIPETGENQNNDQPSKVDIDFQNDTTTVSWNKNNNDIFRVYFIQDDEIHYYFVRDINTLNIFYNDFKWFEEGNVTLRVYGAKADSVSPVNLTSKWSKSNDIIFNAVTHHFRLSYDDSITYSTIPEILSEATTISSNGQVQEDIFAEGAVIAPDGSIEEFDITAESSVDTYYGNSVIPAGSTFSFTYSPSTEGIYILEINNYGGAALVNVPIYIGDIVPLIPDFFDLQDPNETADSINLDEAREELLNYINVERLNHGLGAVYMQDDLNNLAQNYSDQMIRLNFFSHIDLDGKSPDDRRKDFNIKTEVGENLALAPSLYFGHEALMRSAIHRKNILDPDWDTVGLGIGLDNYGYLILTQEFSHEPWDESDLIKFENQTIDGINEQRSTFVLYDQNLRNTARQWSQKMIDENFFSFTSPAGINLIDEVQSTGVTSEGRAFILKEGTLEGLIDKLINESDVLMANWRKVGVGIKQDKWSTLYLTVIYTQ